MARKPVIKPFWWVEIGEIRAAEPDVQPLEGGAVAGQREGEAVGGALEAA